MASMFDTGVQPLRHHNLQSPLGGAIGNLSTRLLAEMAAKERDTLKRSRELEDRDAKWGREDELREERIILENERTISNRDYESNKQKALFKQQNKLASDRRTHEKGMKEAEYKQNDKVLMQRFALEVSKGNIEEARRLSTQLQTIDAQKDANLDLKKAQWGQDKKVRDDDWKQKAKIRDKEFQYAIGLKNFDNALTIAKEKRGYAQWVKEKDYLEGIAMDAEDRAALNAYDKEMRDADVASNKALKAHMYKVKEEIAKAKSTRVTEMDKNRFKLYEEQYKSLLDTKPASDEDGYELWKKDWDALAEDVKVFMMPEEQQLPYLENKKKLEDEAAKQAKDTPTIKDSSKSMLDVLTTTPRVEINSPSVVSEGPSGDLDIDTIRKIIQENNPNMNPNQLTQAVEQIKNAPVDKLLKGDFSGVTVTPAEKIQIENLVRSRVDRATLEQYLTDNRISKRYK